MEYKEWLQSLKPGDKFYTDAGKGAYRIYEVSRVTKTQIITKSKDVFDGSKFNRITGNLIGSGMWYSELAMELTPKIIYKINIRNYIYKLNNYEFGKLNESTLIKVYNILFNQGYKDEE